MRKYNKRIFAVLFYAAHTNTGITGITSEYRKIQYTTYTKSLSPCSNNEATVHHVLQYYFRFATGFHTTRNSKYRNYAKI